MGSVARGMLNRIFCIPRKQLHTRTLHRDFSRDHRRAVQWVITVPRFTEKERRTLYVISSFIAIAAIPKLSRYVSFSSCARLYWLRLYWLRVTLTARSLNYFRPFCFCATTFPYFRNECPRGTIECFHRNYFSSLSSIKRLDRRWFDNCWDT